MSRDSKIIMFECDFCTFFNSIQLVVGGNADELPRHKNRSFIIILPVEQLKKITYKEGPTSNATEH